MASLPIHWIEAKGHVHATEDEPRVLQALDFACPGPSAARDPYEGHFGNPIVRLTRRLRGPAEIRAAWDVWRAAGLLPHLAEDVDRRVDDGGVLHFRLDKQAAFLRSLRLAGDRDAIDVRVRIKAHPAKPDAFRAAARELLREAE